jgi:hypothetical protein
MLGNIFYRFDPLLICMVLMGVLLVAEELGFRLKGKTEPGSGNIEKADVALILGAVNDTAGSLAWVYLCDVPGPF